MTTTKLHDLPNDTALLLKDPPKLSHILVDEAADSLLRATSYLGESAQKKVLHACVFGDIAHIKDKRKSGEPYITHPIAVAEILAGFGLDKDTIIAAVLHDTVEDTYVDLDTIGQYYGDDVTKLVDGVTKLKSSAMSRKQSQAATFYKILSATVADPRVLIIKLSDRLHNMSTLHAVSEEKQKLTAQETLQFYVPFARIMGLNDIADYIELLCYRNLDAPMYTKLSDKLLQYGLGRKLKIENTQSILQQKLTALSIFGTVTPIDNRTSMYRQFFNNRGVLNRIVHQYQFEVVLDDIQSCYKFADDLINSYHISPNNIQDNIKKPLAGGNQSLILIYEEDAYNSIKVTLLTKRMQKAARLGVLGQGENDISQSVIQASLRNLQDLVQKEQVFDNPDDCAHVVSDLIHYLNARKIVCYSPTGQAFELPRGAVALDFAYAVGPKIGNMAISACISGSDKRLASPLNDGDTVQIITQQDAWAKAEWLGFVATNKARVEILKALKNLPSDKKIQYGKAALERALKTYNKNLSDISTSDWLDVLRWRGILKDDSLKDNTSENAMLPYTISQDDAKNVNCKSANTLHHNTKNIIGQRTHITPQQLLSLQHELFLQISKGAILPQLVMSRLFSEKDDSNSTLLAGVHGVEINFARCCNPIYGDNIVGHLSKNGLMLHRHKCYSLVGIRRDNPYQIINLEWRKLNEQDNSHNLRFLVRLRIFARLNEEQISQAIYEMKSLNIGVESATLEEIDFSHNIHKEAGTILRLVVRSRTHLAKGIDKLRQLLGYPNIMRLYQ